VVEGFAVHHPRGPRSLANCLNVAEFQKLIINLNIPEGLTCKEDEDEVSTDKN
jgi:hypothetical protein